MKKLLILIVAGALYFHFYPNEKLNNWLLEQKSVVLSYFSDATDTQVRLSPTKVYKDISRDFAQFNSKINFDMAMYYIRQVAKKFNATFHTYDNQERGSEMILSIPLVKFS